MNFIVGKKLNMSQVFMDSGEVVPVTMVKAGPMTITQIKDKNGKDKYSALQLSSLGKKFEVRVDDVSKYEVGNKIDLSTFQEGEVVNIIGTMKGRGFAGAMKRHGFAGFPASHGHDRPRSVGSIGQRFPQHTRKGLRMSGHMGTQQVTVKNLQVVHVDAAKNVVAIKGAIPGHRNGIIKIVSTGKVKPVVRVVEVKEDKKKK